MSDSPEVKTQEQQDIDFIKQFKQLGGTKLAKYEENNRDKIMAASIAVREAFNEKYTEVIGSPYFRPVTSIKEVVKKTERVDPKSKEYKGFWEVIFSPKAKPDDPNDVTLAMNGVCLQMKREAPVVIPGPFLEVADHGVYATYIQLPNQDRKVAGHIKFFPYTVLREATEEEYIAQKKSGNEITKAARKAAETV
jgi:hypothetical protein